MPTLGIHCLCPKWICLSLPLPLLSLHPTLPILVLKCILKIFLINSNSVSNCSSYNSFLWWSQAYWFQWRGTPEKEHRLSQNRAFSSSCGCCPIRWYHLQAQEENSLEYTATELTLSLKQQTFKQTKQNKKQTRKTHRVFCKSTELWRTGTDPIPP